MQRQSADKQPLMKQPSSVNSSESESQASNMQSGASADSQRSVYLHATTVADIPPATLVNQRQRKSREDLSKLSASSAGSADRATLSRRTRQISRSYSVLAPWKPRHYREKYHISYSNQQQPAGASFLKIATESSLTLTAIIRLHYQRISIFFIPFDSSFQALSKVF